MKANRQLRPSHASGLPLRAALAGVCALALVSLTVPTIHAEKPPPTASQSGKPSTSASAAPAPAADSDDDKAPKVELEGKVEDRAPLRSQVQNPWEFNAFYGALVTAKYTTNQAFSNSARRDVTYAHLYDQPSHYRGQVIRYEGILRRLLRLDAPTFTWSQGLKAYYEGWVFDPEIHGANPMCLVFTELPAGLEVGEKLDKRVRFDGYFFKLYGYKAADNTPRAVPLLIGHAPVLVPAPAVVPAEDGTSNASDYVVKLIAAGVGLVGVTAGLIIGLNWWYRRGDQRVRARLDALRNPDFVEPTFEAKPPGDGEEG